jgi:hypothetical protein
MFLRVLTHHPLSPAATWRELVIGLKIGVLTRADAGQ